MSGRVIIQSKPKEPPGTVYFIILTLCQEVSTSPKHRPNYKTQFANKDIFFCKKEHTADGFPTFLKVFTQS